MSRYVVRLVASFALCLCVCGIVAAADPDTEPLSQKDRANLIAELSCVDADESWSSLTPEEQHAAITLAYDNFFLNVSSSKLGTARALPDLQLRPTFLPSTATIPDLVGMPPVAGVTMPQPGWVSVLWAGEIAEAMPKGPAAYVSDNQSKFENLIQKFRLNPHETLSTDDNRLFLMSYMIAYLEASPDIQAAIPGQTHIGISGLPDAGTVVLVGSQLSHSFHMMTDSLDALSGRKAGITDDFLLNVVPSSVPSEQLINSKTANVYQFAVNASRPQFLRSDISNRRMLTFTSDNLLSTNSLDSEAKIDTKFEYLSSLASHSTDSPLTNSNAALDTWLEYTSNQLFTSQTVDYNFGLKDPFGVLEGVHLGKLVASDAGPDFTLSGEFEDRARQDPRIDMTHSASSTYGAAGTFNWDTLHLFPSDRSSRMHFGDWILAVDANGWWFGDDKSALTNSAASPWAGQLKASLNIPLSFLSAITQPSTGAATELQIQYSDGADPSNGYIYSHDWSINVNAAKSM